MIQMNIYLKKKNNNTIIYYNMINKNMLYGGAGVVGVGVLYFLYSKFSNNDSRQTSDDKTNKSYEEWTGSLPKAVNWGGGKTKKNKKTKHIRNRKGKNSRRK
jgi:hypothetical protein